MFRQLEVTIICKYLPRSFFFTEKISEHWKKLQRTSSWNETSKFENRTQAFEMKGCISAIQLRRTNRAYHCRRQFSQFFHESSDEFLKPKQTALNERERRKICAVWPDWILFAISLSFCGSFVTLTFERLLGSRQFYCLDLLSKIIYSLTATFRHICDFFLNHLVTLEICHGDLTVKPRKNILFST